MRFAVALTHHSSLSPETRRQEKLETARPLRHSRAGAIGMRGLTLYQSTSKAKAGQLWPKNKDDLLKQLGELKTELSQLRTQKVVSSGSKLNKM